MDYLPDDIKFLISLQFDLLKIEDYERFFSCPGLESLFDNEQFWKFYWREMIDNYYWQVDSIEKFQYIRTMVLYDFKNPFDIACDEGYNKLLLNILSKDKIKLNDALKKYNSTKHSNIKEILSKYIPKSELSTRGGVGAIFITNNPTHGSTKIIFGNTNKIGDRGVNATVFGLNSVCNFSNSFVIGLRDDKQDVHSPHSNTFTIDTGVRGNKRGLYYVNAPSGKGKPLLITSNGQIVAEKEKKKVSIREIDKNIDDLKPISYVADGKREFGFDESSVLPEVNDNGKINTEALLALAVKEIIELKKEVAMLKQQLQH